MKVGNGKTNSDKLESSLSLKKTKNDYYLRDNYMDYEQIEHLWRDDNEMRTNRLRTRLNPDPRS